VQSWSKDAQNHHFHCISHLQQTVTAAAAAQGKDGNTDTELNIPFQTVYIILETVFPANHLTGTNKTEPNYNQVQVTTQTPK